ncbi:fasciclin domain-containing protein, partial [Amycolatopsis sp. NPDC004625]
MTKLRVAGIGVAAVAALSLTACSSSDTASSGSSSSSMAPSSSMAAPSSSMASGTGNGVTTNADVFGPACSQLPQGSAPGSLDSMGPQPVASAAST